MADYVRVMISIAAQWRVVRALGPAALALAGVPVAEPARPAQPRAIPHPAQRTAGPGRLDRLVLPAAPPPNHHEQRAGVPAPVRPQNGNKAWK